MSWALESALCRPARTQAKQACDRSHEGCNVRSLAKERWNTAQDEMFDLNAKGCLEQLPLIES